MIQSKTLKALALAMAGSALALGGCGSDGGGGSSGSSVGTAYDGTGTEALGWYVAEVTASTGIYGSDGHYAPVGLTRHLELYLSGDSLYLHYDQDSEVEDHNDDSGEIELIGDPGTKTYEGLARWEPDGGLAEDEHIDEYWTLSFSGDTVTLKIDGVVDAFGGPSGTATFVLRPLAAAPSDVWAYGKVTSHTDSRSVGQSSYHELWADDDNDGAEGEIYTDASYQWGDYFWAPLYRDGNKLRGGQHSDTSYQDARADGFATLVFTLDTLDRPVSASVNVSDYSNLDTDDHRDSTEPATWSASIAAFQMVEKYTIAYAALPQVDLTIDTITEGGALEDAFGFAGDTLINAFNFYPYDYYTEGFVLQGNYFWGGYVSSTKREIVAWDGRYYDYENDYVGYDFDEDADTEERLTITIDYDDTTLPAIPVGGSLKREVYNALGTKIGTEDMTFTLNGAPVISSSLTASGDEGSVFSTYTITASHSADSYSASGLPTGLAINTGNGQITGTPTVAGVYNVTIGATNEAGTGTATLVITVNAVP